MPLGHDPASVTGAACHGRNMARIGQLSGENRAGASDRDSVQRKSGASSGRAAITKRGGRLRLENDAGFRPKGDESGPWRPEAILPIVATRLPAWTTLPSKVPSGRRRAGRAPSATVMDTVGVALAGLEHAVNGAGHGRIEQGRGPAPHGWCPAGSDRRAWPAREQHPACLGLREPEIHGLTDRWRRKIARDHPAQASRPDSAASSSMGSTPKRAGDGGIVILLVGGRCMALPLTQFQRRGNWPLASLAYLAALAALAALGRARHLSAHGQGARQAA